jgi:hypothetical protein
VKLAEDQERFIARQPGLFLFVGAVTVAEL